jgi:hypothetical protein
MRRKFGHHWVEYMDPIHLMDRPSNIEIGLYAGIKKESTNGHTVSLII